LEGSGDKANNFQSLPLSLLPPTQFEESVHFSKLEGIIRIIRFCGFQTALSQREILI
jgi:hypothetical protein